MENDVETFVCAGCHTRIFVSCQDSKPFNHKFVWKSVDEIKEVSYCYWCDLDLLQDFDLGTSRKLFVGGDK